MTLFAIATLCPFFGAIFTILWGGIWGPLTVGYMTVLLFLLDRLLTLPADDVDEDMEFPASNLLLVTLAAAHFILLFAGLWAIVGPSGLSLSNRALLALVMAWIFGQISHPAAHELIHKQSRRMRLLGQLVYSSMLTGHHASAHLRVHHVHVGSRSDPNTARKGQGFYRFAIRAWMDGFRAGLQAENRLRQGRSVWRHPYILYISVAAGLTTGALVALGIPGVAALLFVGALAQMQILLSDYVQHYGLERHRLADGRLEPVGPQHAWNAPQWFSSAMMLNATRHSDHHMTPGRPYPALRLDDIRMPYLPRSLPVMAAIALVPPVWRSIMDPLCEDWQSGWIKPRKPGIRDIPPAALAAAKSGGTGGVVLPKSGHADLFHDPVPGHTAPAARRRNADDSGGV